MRAEGLRRLDDVGAGRVALSINFERFGGPLDRHTAFEERVDELCGG